MHIGNHAPDTPVLNAWRKSSYSGGSNGNCLEVAAAWRGGVPVRDSKNMEGPVVTFGAEAFAVFVGAVREGII